MWQSLLFLYIILFADPSKMKDPIIFDFGAKKDLANGQLLMMAWWSFPIQSDL